MNVETIYQEVLLPLTKEQKQQIIEKLTRELQTPQTDQRKRSILELSGLFPGILKGRDAQDYINKIRDEWDEHS